MLLENHHAAFFARASSPSTAFSPNGELATKKGVVWYGRGAEIVSYKVYKLYTIIHLEPCKGKVYFSGKSNDSSISFSIMSPVYIKKVKTKTFPEVAKRLLDVFTPWVHWKVSVFLRTMFLQRTSASISADLRTVDVAGYFTYRKPCQMRGRFMDDA